MSLESVEEVETDPTGSLEEVTTEPLGLTSTSPTASTSAASEFEGAPPPRRRSLSKLRRRLSRTFRLSFSGSLSDFAQNFSIDERGETSETGSGAGAPRSLDAEDILPNKFNGHHHVPSVQSRLRTITNLTRKLSLSNSRIIETPSYNTSTATASRLSRTNGGIGKIHFHL
jgi:hypothetical protein